MNAGYAAALATALVWGLTFVSTKMLLVTFTPVEILFIRFVIGTVVLFIIAPRRLRTKGWDEEKYFIIAGLSGVSLYYFMENVALVWSTASNVGVIVSTAPFFTALFSSEKKSRWFFIGFIAAILGIAAMSFGSLEVSKETLLGDMLSLFAAATWGIYSVASKKISTFGYSSILTTRRSFLYGIIAIAILVLFWNGWGTDRDVFAAANILHLLFLGAIASALCFVMWNVAVSRIGAIRTSVFIYLVPVVTVVASAIFLGERITPMTGLGTALTLLGLVLSGK